LASIGSVILFKNKIQILLSFKTYNFAVFELFLKNALSANELSCGR